MESYPIPHGRQNGLMETDLGCWSGGPPQASEKQRYICSLCSKGPGDVWEMLCKGNILPNIAHHAEMGRECLWKRKANRGLINDECVSE